MANTPFFVQSNTLYLAGSGVVIGATTIVLTSLTDIYSNVLTMADFGTKGYITLEPDTTNEEAATFTGITANTNGTYTLTGVSTVLAKSPYTETSGLARAHSGGTKVVITDSAAFWANIKAYIDAAIVSGGVNATTTVQGTVQLPTAAQINSGTATGSTGAALGIAPDSLAASNYGLNIPSADQKLFLNAATGMLMQYAGSAAPTGFLLCDGSAVSRATYATLFAVISTTYGTGDGSTTFNVPDGRGRTFIGAGTGTKVATFASRSSDTITVTGLTNVANNEFQTGQAVTYHSATTVITGLTNDTVYYVIRVSNTSFMLASSLANAVAGTQISLSSNGSGTQTFTLALSVRTRGDTGGEENHALTIAEMATHTHSIPGGAGSTTYNVGSGVGSSGGTTGSTGSSNAHSIMQPFFVGNWIIKY